MSSILDSQNDPLKPMQDSDGIPPEALAEIGELEKNPETEKNSLALMSALDTNGSATTSIVTEEAPKDEKGRKLFLGNDGIYHPETARAAKAFDDYFKLGGNRTFDQLAIIYADGKHADWNWSTSVQSVKRTIADYSTKFDWQNRVKTVDARETAQVLAHARRTAARRKKVRIAGYQTLQRTGLKIIKDSKIFDAELCSVCGQRPDFEVHIYDNGENEQYSHEFVTGLTPKEARFLLKEAIKMIDIGAQGEKAEIGEALTKIAPPKPLSSMSKEELDAYIDVLMAELQ